MIFAQYVHKNTEVKIVENVIQNIDKITGIEQVKNNNTERSVGGNIRALEA